MANTFQLEWWLMIRSLRVFLSVLCLSFFLFSGVFPAYGVDFEGNKLILPLSPEKKRELYNAAIAGDAEGEYSHTAQTAVPGGSPSGVLTLEDAINAAVQTHPSIRSAVELLVQQGYLVSAAKAGYLPQISVELNTERESNEDLAITPTLYVSQMLFDFGRTKSEVCRARAGLAKQTIMAMDQIDSIILQTAGALINVHRYQEQLTAAEDQIKNVDLVVKMAEQRARSGLASESDPVQAQTRFEAAKANLLSVQTLLSQTREQLALVTSLRHTGPIAPMDPALVARADIYNTPDYENMTVYLTAHADYNLAGAQLDAARAAAYPTLGAIASIEKTLTGDNPNTGIEEDDHSTVGLRVSQSLYQGGRVAAQRRAAASARESAFQSLAAAELRAKELISISKLEIEGLQKRRQILVRRTENIKTTRSLYQEQYQLGTRSVLDLLNSEQEYYQAVVEELAADHELWNNLVYFMVLKGDARGIFHADSRLSNGTP